MGRSASAAGTIIVPIPAEAAVGNAGAGENAGGEDGLSEDGSDSGDGSGGTVEVSVDVELPVYFLCNTIEPLNKCLDSG